MEFLKPPNRIYPNPINLEKTYDEELSANQKKR